MCNKLGSVYVILDVKNSTLGTINNMKIVPKNTQHNILFIFKLSNKTINIIFIIIKTK